MGRASQTKPATGNRRRETNIVPLPSEDGTRSGTLRRGLAILETLIQGTRPLNLSEISDVVKLDQSSTFRILRTLENEGYVLRLHEGKRYLAAPRTLKPLSLAHPLEQFRREAAALIADLGREFSKTAILVVYVGMERLVIDVCQSTGAISPYYDSWLRGPLHGSAPGKAFLLSMTEQRRRDLLGPEPYAAHTPRTILRWDDLAADLRDAENRGYVVQTDEFHDGITAMACNYASWSGRVAGCIALTGHTHSFDPDTIAKAGSMLMRTAKLIPMQAPALQLLDQFCGA